MSFKAILYIENQERTLINAELVYSQLADINGRPTQLPMGAPLEIEFPSNARDDLFYEYMFAPNRMCKGHIRFFKRDGMQKDFDIEFANAHIIGLKEHFSSTGAEPMHIKLTISYGISRVRGIIHEKKWNPSNPFIASTATPIQRQVEKEPKMIESYYEDQKGNRIPENRLKVGDEVYLVIKTKDAIGKLITIDLADNSRDFEYNGEVLENDILEGITIKADIQGVALKVVPQTIIA